jgi:uncharacterized lipoprotein YehR (DUF1307 family)
MRYFSIRTALLAMVLPAMLVMAGCDKISGKYADEHGMVTVEFKSGKAYVTTAGGAAIESTYDVDGDKVTMHVSGTDMVFTKNSDGSLTGGPLGSVKLIKQ